MFVFMVVVLLDSFRGMGVRADEFRGDPTDQRWNSAEEDASERLRCGTIQKEMS